MSRSRPPGIWLSGAKLCPRTIRSGVKSTAGKTGKGTRYRRGVLVTPHPGRLKPRPSWANTGASSTADSKLKALVAVARSLVIIWNLPSRPGLRFHDLGVDYHTNRIDTERRTRNHVRQLEALGLHRLPDRGRLT